MNRSPLTAYRSVAPNDVTPDRSAAACDTGIADTDDRQENEEEDCVGDDTSDEEYIPDAIDDSNDEEEEDTRREVAEDQEREEDEQEDGNADEGGTNSSDTTVYLGVKGSNEPGSREYRNTVKHLAKTYSVHWSEGFFKLLLKKHPPNTFMRILENRSLRTVSLKEIESAARDRLYTYRSSQGGGGKKRKSSPKVASWQHSDDEDDDGDYESDQDQKVAKSQKKTQHNKKQPPHKTRGLGRKVKIDKLSETEEDEREYGNPNENRIGSIDTYVFLGSKGKTCPGSVDYRNTLQRLAKMYNFQWSYVFYQRLLERHKANEFRIGERFNGDWRWREASSSEIESAASNALRKIRDKDRAYGGGVSGRSGKKRKSYPKAASRQRSDGDDDDDDEDEVTDNGTQWPYDDYESDQDKKPAAKKKTQAKKRPPNKTRVLVSELNFDELTKKHIADLQERKEVVSKSNDPKVYSEGKEILNQIVQLEESLTKRGI
jgi:hypothetical protein